MTKSKTASLLCALAGSLCVVSAAEPIATISSSAPFVLRGATVNPIGVARWPVMAGDTFESGSSSAVVQFKDGSRVAMSENSRATIITSGDQVTFRLVSGSMQVAPASGTHIIFNNNGSTEANTKGVSKDLAKTFASAPKVAPALSNR